MGEGLRIGAAGKPLALAYCRSADARLNVGVGSTGRAAAMTTCRLASALRQLLLPAAFQKRPGYEPHPSSWEPGPQRAAGVSTGGDEPLAGGYTVATETALNDVL